MYALKAVTGAVKWSYTTGGPVVSSPAVAGGVVYIGSDDGNVYALNATTGARRGPTPPSAPCFVARRGQRGRLVGSDDGKVTRSTRPPGLSCWTYTTGSSSSRRPPWPTGSSTSAPRTATCTRSTPRPGPGCGPTPPAVIGASPAVANGVVYIGSRTDKVYALNAATGPGVDLHHRRPVSSVVARGGQRGRLHRPDETRCTR